MRLLLAVDDSKYSEAAAQAVAAQYQAKDTEVEVLDVVDLAIPIPTSYGKGFREESLRRGRELVQRTGQMLSKAGFKVQTTVEEGDPKSRIIDHAARWGADLIVVGSHGRKGVEHFLMGSVSEAVVRHAPWPWNQSEKNTSGSSSMLDAKHPRGSVLGFVCVSF